MKHQKLALSLVVAFLCCSNVFAQWESIGNVLPTNYRVWNIKIAPDSSVWMATALDPVYVTSSSPVRAYRSADAGANWTATRIAQTNAFWGSDIAPVNKDIAYIAADSSGLFRTMDGGQTWTKMDSFPRERAYFVHFFNENEGWVLGGSIDSFQTSRDGFYLMMVTSDGGNSWTTIGGKHWVQPIGTSLPSLDTTEIFGFAFSNSCYDVSGGTILVGTTKGTYWKSSDKGYNWTRHRAPLADSSMDLTNIAMKDENTFMVAGDVFVDTLADTFLLVHAINYTTTDGGNTWIQGHPGVTAASSHYLPNSDSVFIMFGHRDFSGVGDQGTVISYDYGKNWQKIDNNRLITIDFLDENIGYGTCCSFTGWSGSGGDGEVFKWNYTVSIDELLNPEWIKLMPNPVSTTLTLEIDQDFQYHDMVIEIIAANGQILSTHQADHSDRIKIPVEELTRGFYFLRITGDQKSITRKFVKK